MGWVQRPGYEEIPGNKQELSGVRFLEPDAQILIEVQITSVPWGSVGILIGQKGKFENDPLGGRHGQDGINFLRGGFKELKKYFPELETCPADKAKNAILKALKNCKLKMTLEGGIFLKSEIFLTDGRIITTTDLVRRLKKVLLPNIN